MTHDAGITSPGQSAVSVTSGSPAIAAGHELEHVPGRPISWAGVSVACAGTVVGCAGMIPHMTWWLFWLGAAITVVGLFVLLFAKTFSEDWY